MYVSQRWGCFEPLVVKRTKKYEIFPANSQVLLTAFFAGGMGDFTKGKRLFAGFRNISSEVQKSSCTLRRSTVYRVSPKKEVACKWMLTGGRSGDVSCQKKDVSCRWPRKARKICYLEHAKLENCPGTPPAVSIIVKER